MHTLHQDNYSRMAIMGRRKKQRLLYIICIYIFKNPSICRWKENMIEKKKENKGRVRETFTLHINLLLPHDHCVVVLWSRFHFFWFLLLTLFDSFLYFLYIFFCTSHRWAFEIFFLFLTLLIALYLSFMCGCVSIMLQIV